MYKRLNKRGVFFKKYLAWLNDRKPDIFWISGLFFPQAFLTGAIQNAARKYNYEIDRIDFLYKFMSGHLKPADITGPPSDGIIFVQKV